MYDKKKADKVITFFEKYLSHTKGEFAGKPFILLPWEKDLLRKLYGNVDKKGLRIYNQVYCQIAKKNGKSEFAAGLGLFSLCADDEKGAEVYSAAVDREQAGIVFSVACQMVEQNYQLKKNIKIIPSKKRMVYKPTNSFYQVLSSDVAAKHGLNISVCLIDELHAFKDRKLFEVLTQGSTAARKQPIIFVITTAGDNEHSVCYEQYQYAKKVKNGIIKNPYYLPIIYEMDEDDEWENPKNWKKANPSLDVTISTKGMKNEFNMAMEIPSLEMPFRQLRLNQWIFGKINKWIKYEHWTACKKEFDLKLLQDMNCFGGLDLASVNDLVSFCLTFPIEGFYYIHPFFWIPEDNLKERVRRDKVPYDVWAKKGFIKITQGNVCDYDVIENDIIELQEIFNIKQINFDRWNAHQIVTHLDNEGFNMVGFGQGFVSMSPPTKELINLTLQKKLIHNNEVLDWNASNMVLKTDPAGNMKPDKEKSSEKIDGMVALIMSLDASIRNAQAKSVYESRGLISI